MERSITFPAAPKLAFYVWDCPAGAASHERRSQSPPPVASLSAELLAGSTDRAVWLDVAYFLHVLSRLP